MVVEEEYSAQDGQKKYKKPWKWTGMTS